MEDGLDHSLEELISTTSYQWIFVGGKGGVGKTTTSCSVALELSKIRESVLIISTDPAHNISDAFGQKFCGTPTQVEGVCNLFAMEVDAQYQRTTSASNLQLQQEEGWKHVLHDLLSSLPGADEALSFAELMQSVQTMKYSTIVFDTAPTGHTLRLLKFPDVLESALTKLDSLRSKIDGALQMINMISGQQYNQDDVYTRLDNLKKVVTSVRETLQDPTKTTFVCVCIPEFLSVYETERLVQQLADQGIDCSNIVVNQVLAPLQFHRDSPQLMTASSDDKDDEENQALPNDLSQCHEVIRSLRRDLQTSRIKLRAYEKSFFSRRRMQRKYLEQIETLYGEDFHVVFQPLMEEEVRGVPSLRVFAKELLTPSPAPLEDLSLSAS